MKPWYSYLTHILYGFFTSLFYFHISPWFSFVNYASFHVYEFVEYFIIKDKVYLDIREFYAGLAVGGILHILHIL